MQIKKTYKINGASTRTLAIIRKDNYFDVLNLIVRAHLSPVLNQQEENVARASRVCESIQRSFVSIRIDKGRNNNRRKGKQMKFLFAFN